MTFTMFSTLTGPQAAKAMYFFTSSSGFRLTMADLRRSYGRFRYNVVRDSAGRVTSTIEITVENEDRGAKVVNYLTAKVEAIQADLCNVKTFRVTASRTAINRTVSILAAIARAHDDIYTLWWNNKTQEFEISCKDSKTHGFIATIRSKVLLNEPKKTVAVAAKTGSSWAAFEESDGESDDEEHDEIVPRNVGGTNKLPESQWSKSSLRRLRKKRQAESAEAEEEAMVAKTAGELFVDGGEREGEWADW
jgi:hypothetical protein